MQIPYLAKDRRISKTVLKLCGIDRRYRADRGAFRDMENMSGISDHIATTRNRRGKIDIDEEIYSMICADIVIDGEIKENAFIVHSRDRLYAFYHEGGELVKRTVMNTVSFMSEKNNMVLSGSYLYFFPDKKYINLMNTNDKGSLEASTVFYHGFNNEYCYEIVCEETDIDGLNVSDYLGYTRIKCNKYNADGGIKGSFVSEVPISPKLCEGDFVDIDGKKYEIAFIPFDLNYIVVCGNIASINHSIEIKRSVPDMDHVIAFHNRLWGCKYGIVNGVPVNEIYASALGDAKNWYSFGGGVMDSFAATVGCEGVFTGAAVYDETPIFFKENNIIRIYGDYPAEYSVVTSSLRGVEKGSVGSISLVNDVLYYKTHSGIVGYTGGTPYNIDRALGVSEYKNAVSGECRGRYYISMQNEKEEYELYVYDCEAGVWYKEDNTRVYAFTRCGSELYMLTDRGLLSAFGGGDHFEKNIKWKLETGDIGLDDPRDKILTEVLISLKSEELLYLSVEIEYDMDSVWHFQNSTRACSGLVKFPIDINRCSSFRIRFSGEGECRVNSLSVLYSVVRES